MTQNTSDDDNLRAWIALSKTPGIGSKTFNQLLDYFETPSKVLSSHAQALKQSGLSSKLVERITSIDLNNADDEFRWLDSSENNHILTLAHDIYPKLLRETDNPPPILYIQGSPELLNDPQLAMVGSRNPTREGIATAESFASHLSSQGICITSGLALGIDGFSHKGALDVDGPTVAVIATGADRVYPAKHRHLAHRIAESGAIVTEFPLKTSVKPGHFPRRNRIISGLSLGTLVVEAAVKSGSLITARYASEQGRDVFAIPGSIHNPLAKGCHQLIRQGAKLVETANDILEEFGALLNMTSFVSHKNVQLMQENSAIEPICSDNSQNYSPEYLELLQAIGYDSISIDQIVMKTGFTPEAVSSILLILELDGKVAACGNGLYKQLMS